LPDLLPPKSLLARIVPTVKATHVQEGRRRNLP